MYNPVAELSAVPIMYVRIHSYDTNVFLHTYAPGPGKTGLISA